LSLYKAIAMLGKLKYTGILSGMGVGQGGGMAESEGSLRFKITKAENAIFRQLSLYIATQQKTERESEILLFGLRTVCTSKQVWIRTRGFVYNNPTGKRQRDNLQFAL
jgi:hypothetical protein